MKSGDDFKENYYYPNLKGKSQTEAFREAASKYEKDKGHDAPYSSVHSVRQIIRRKR